MYIICTVYIPGIYIDIRVCVCEHLYTLYFLTHQNMSEVLSKPTRSCNLPTDTNWQSANDTERPVTTGIVTCFFVRGFLILRYPHPGNLTGMTGWKQDVSPIKNGDFPLSCYFLGGVSFTNFTSSQKKVVEFHLYPKMFNCKVGDVFGTLKIKLPF